MEASYKLLKTEIQGYTTREIKMRICRDKIVRYDSIFLLDNNEQLITADKTYIDDEVQYIYVYDLQDYYDYTKKEISELKIQSQMDIQNQKYIHEQLLQQSLKNAKKTLEEQQKQFTIQQESNKTELERKIKDLESENNSAINQLRNELQEANNKLAKQKEKNDKETQQKQEQIQQLVLQLKQLSELQQDLQTKISQIDKLNEDLSKQLAQQKEVNQQIQQQFLKKTQQQAQQFNMQIGSITEEKKGLDIQMQSNEKKQQQIIADLEEKLQSVSADFGKQLKLQKTKNEELEQENKKLIKRKENVGTELEKCKVELQGALNKQKTLEQDYQDQSQRLRESTDQDKDKLKKKLSKKKNQILHLNIESQQIPKLQKKIEQKEQDYQKQKLVNEEEQQQLESKVTYVKKELQTMTTKCNELQNSLLLTQNEKQQLKESNEKLIKENSEQRIAILNGTENDQLKKDMDQLQQDLTQKGIEITSLNQQISSLNEKLQKTQTDLIEMQKLKIQAEKAIRDLELDLANLQNNNEQLTKEKTDLEQVREHLKQQFKDSQQQLEDSEQQLEDSKFQVQILKRKIKPVINQNIDGLVEKFNQKFEKKFSNFIAYPDIQTQDYQFELFAIQVDNQAEFDRSLLKSLNLQQLSKFISFKSLGVQTIKKTIQPNSDSTFFEGYIFQIQNPSGLANNYDPNIKTKVFLMKTIKMLKNNGFLPKSGDEGKQLLIPNLASMSILNQFITQLHKKGIKPPAFKFPQQYMIQAQTENDKYFYHVEELVDGELLKLNAFKIFDSCSPEVQFSNSLAFYSFRKLQEQAMLTNIQGIKSADGTITLYDTLLCSQQGLSSDIDQGNEEISKLKELIENAGWKSLGDFYDKIKDEFQK